MELIVGEVNVQYLGYISNIFGSPWKMIWNDYMGLVYIREDMGIVWNTINVQNAVVFHGMIQYM